MKRIFFIFGVLCLVFLGGCIQYNENLVFNPDWSGKLLFSIGVGESIELEELGDFEEDSIKQQFDKISGLNILTSKTYYDDGIKWVEFNIEFENLEILAEVDKVFEQAGFIGKISTHKDEEGNLIFTREMSVEVNPHGHSRESLTGILSHFYWTYSTQFPDEVLNANTEEKNIDNETNTVKWSINMASLMSGPQMMSARIKQPKAHIISWPFFAAFLCILIVLLLSLLKVKRPEKKM